jgi:cellulose synthase/poly-beta-1,6-N-acetylglucosamine synthase-like glycosyltransferase
MDTDTLRNFFDVFGLVAVAYFAALNLTYIVFTGMAWRSITGHLRARRFSGVSEALASPLTPPVSVMLPAYNEQAGIVESIHSLLALRYPEHEVVVVNDGSTDSTVERLIEAFDMTPIDKALRDTLVTKPVRATYVSRRDPQLWLIDKDNGGKSDALNAGLNAARYPYVCAVDADAILEQDALLRVAKPIIDDPDLVVAAGGIVRIANGCTVDRGQVLDVRLPESRVATFQVIEYFRAFLVGRVGWSRLGSLLIISGAFGLFKREAVEAAGGYRTDTVGEDAELVVRMHRTLRDRGDDYRIEFVPDPVCWTEAPESLRVLSRQRRRWQRGLGETLWRHKGMFGRPRYGAVGMLALPYFLIFELVGPLFQVVSFIVMPVAYALGMLDTAILVTFAVVAILLGVLLSVAALALEEFSFRRHRRAREAIRMLVYAVAENFGFRQLVDFWRLQALWDLARRKKGWGEMKRRGFAALTPVAPIKLEEDSGQCAVDSGSGRDRASDQTVDRPAELVGR